MTTPGEIKDRIRFYLRVVALLIMFTAGTVFGRLVLGHK